MFCVLETWLKISVCELINWTQYQGLYTKY